MNNRIIKFRFYNNITKDRFSSTRTYFEGTVSELLISENGDIKIYKEGETDQDHTLNDKYTMSQYTGLKDSNGVEIFEGDVIRIEDEHNALVSFEDGCFVYRIIYNNKGKYNLTTYILLQEWIDKDDILSDTIVIGNIHENPELLNK